MVELIGNSETETSIFLYDLSGKFIDSQNITGQNQVQFNNLVSGVYIMKGITKLGSFTKKIIIN
jgi:hypothetical protein